MQNPRYLIDMEVRDFEGESRLDDFPIRVAEDWDALMTRADRMAEVIDRHLEFESKLQGRELRPCTLCPEQKVSLVTDIIAV